jgi:hypothetical protein
MKKINLMLKLMVYCVIVFACNKEKEPKNFTSVLYENKTNKDSTMSGFLLGASTKIILQIDTGNSMLDLIRNSPSWKQIISNNTIDNSKIMITSYYGSNIRVVSIPILNLVSNNQETCYNIYINNNNFIFTKMVISTLKNKLISVQDMDDKVYYTVELDVQNRLGNWNVKKDIPLQRYLSTERYISNGTETTQTTETWNECMNRCITKVCGSSWICASLCSVTLPSCLAGAALACMIN